MISKFVSVTLIIFAMIIWPLLAQQKTTAGSAVSNAFDIKDYKLAEKLLDQLIADLIASGQSDSLVNWVITRGEIAYELYGAEKSKKEIHTFLDKARQSNPNHDFHRKLYMQAAEYFANIGENQQGYDMEQLALQAANSITGADPLVLARIEYNLGVYAQRLANVKVSAGHHRRAMALREEAKDTPDEDLYLSFNAMGSIMWYASKYDSAALYFKKALAALTKMPANDVNRYYRPSIIQNNLAGLYGAEGKITEGINAMKECIDNTQKFIASPGPHPKKQNALAGLFEGIDNLAGLYKEIGDYYKAGDLLRYSYQQKQQKLAPGHPGVFISEILLGQHYNDIREYDKAISFLTSGLAKLKKAEGDYLFWEADACYALALANENKKNIGEARIYYESSEKLFEASYQGEYDNIYLQFLRNASSFYAAHGDYNKARRMTTNGYDYIKKVQGAESLAAFYQLLNLAEISKIAGRFKETIRYSNEGLSVLKYQVGRSTNFLDSVKMQVYQPKAILLKLEAEYALQAKRDTFFLRSLSLQLNEALEILKKRRSLIDDEESIAILVAEHAGLINFARKIEMELYQQTRSDLHLEKFINLHESAIYNRIRNRLDKAKIIQVAGIPASVQEEENRLKAAVPSSLQSGKENSALMTDYMHASAQWNNYLEKLKVQYPTYFNLRYGSPYLRLPEIDSSIPANSTVIRYFFSDSLLYALIADKKGRTLVPLAANGLEDMIKSLFHNNTNETIQSDLLKKLYDQLWKPLEPHIHSEEIVIIPDGILFALSFDLLTPEKALSYKDIVTSSLLARHSISYHYSLYMIGNTGVNDQTPNTYVAFVPGFSDKAKEAYVAAINDSVNLDYQYLSLLSQPNTIRAAEQIKKLIGGKVYMDQASTLQSFKTNAAGHTIVHIGTHAEFNNQLPERSRLIFSKNMGGAVDSNSLFLDAIYDCNIKSSLTILTACETGKPGYEDGEGMISMAHAFSYAGSKSILTGLWKIDEKTSSIITESFVKNLHAGMPAAAALKKAKLEYLAHAHGRTIAPAYWAGLVLIGQTPALTFPGTSGFHWSFLAAGLFLAAIFIYLMRKQRPVS